jgi:branched-chain amino acid transport system substrate-binding protein
MLFLSNGANAPTEFPDKVGKANTEGILSTGTWSADAKTNGNQQFQAEYVKKYGGSPRDIDGNTVDAYAVGQLLEEVAAKTGSVDNDKIIQTLHSGTWSTIQGELRWDAYGAPQGSDVLLQWIGGTLDPVYPPAVATRQPVVTKAPWSR